MDALKHAPEWLLRPLPANAVVDETLNKRIDTMAESLPSRIRDIDASLSTVKSFREYDEAANRACAYVWRALDSFYSAANADTRLDLLQFVNNHMAPRAQARIFRRLVKDISPQVRRKARLLIEQSKLREVAVPQKPDGDWNATGWLKGVLPGRLNRHEQGRRVRERHELPDVANLRELRELLDIRSVRQLGYFLLATDKDGGPYTRFAIPKRDGSEREICAPQKPLRWVQRNILRKILAKVPTHDAAHGFIPGRSTVTNATPHIGARVLLKFDLTDFFPSIHYYRVVGLFASLGYYVEDARFQSADDSRQVAPTLARLCCYTRDPRRWGEAALPQGAPTSPAISNLICRRLDARLTGLAQRSNGSYTRYADDLTFSFKEDLDSLGRFRWWVDQVCQQEGFFVNHRKFRVIRASQRQSVTGIVVNDELRVPRRFRRRFRAILHNCQKNGVTSQARGRSDFVEYLRGVASYIQMIHPEEGQELRQQVEEIADGN